MEMLQEEEWKNKGEVPMWAIRRETKMGWISVGHEGAIRSKR